MTLQEHKDLIKSAALMLVNDLPAIETKPIETVRPKPIKPIKRGAGRFVTKCWYDFAFKLRESLRITEPYSIEWALV